MFTNVVICPACHKHLKVRRSMAADKRVSCPACGRRILPVAYDNPPPVAIPVPPPVPTKPWKVFQLALAAAILFVGIGMGGMMYRATGAEKAPIPVAARVEDRPAVVTAGPPPAIPIVAAPTPAPVVAPAPPMQPPPVAPVAPVAPNTPVAAAPVAPPAPLPQIGLPNVPTIITNPQVGYTTLINEASVAMMEGLYPDARNLYAEALEVAPNIPPAPTAICPPPVNRLDCRTAWVPPQVQTVDPNQGALDGIRQATYQNAMVNGDTAMRAKNYTAAMTDFQTAVNAKPGDQVASFALVQAQGLGL